MSKKSSPKAPKRALIITIPIILIAGAIITLIALTSRSTSTTSSEPKAKTNTQKEIPLADTKVDVDNYNPNKIIAADNNNGQIGDHVRGKKDSKVLVVEYADLACPGCAYMMPYMSELHKEFGDRVAFVFRHYPLSSHQNARSAAAAVESAGYQGYYWEMLEALYSSRNEWVSQAKTECPAIYEKIFKQVAPEGDVAKFRTDMQDSRIQQKIAFDYWLGRERSEVSATPSIFVNGKFIDMSDEDATFNDIVSDIRTKIKQAL